MFNFFRKKTGTSVAVIENRPSEDDDQEVSPKRPSYLAKRPQALRATTTPRYVEETDELPKNLKTLTPEQIDFIMSKIKSGQFKRYERNKKGMSLLHMFSGLGIKKLTQSLLDMIQSDPNVLNALDNNAMSALDYAQTEEIQMLISQYGGRKAVAILERYAQEAATLGAESKDARSQAASQKRQKEREHERGG